MLAQTTCKTNIKSHWLHLRNFSPEWFSNVPSNPLLEQMNNYTGCICMVFLLCQFSNASSDRQPKQRHNSICLDHHGVSDICPLWYTATLFRSVKSTLKSALIRNKIALIGQIGPKFCIFYAKNTPAWKKYTTAGCDLCELWLVSWFGRGSCGDGKTHKLWRRCWS